MTNDFSSALIKEQLEQLIATLVNGWLYEHSQEYSHEDKRETIKKFCNLSLQAVYEMLQNGLLPIAPGNGHVTTDMVQESLESGNYERLRKSYIPDDFMETTPVRKWMMQKEREGVKLSGRLLYILDENADNWDCIEYITKFSFTQCRRAGETAWKEFVAHRGY
jgi:hypothetical protein